MKSAFELVHTNVCGPFTITFLSLAQYILTFIDDHSRFGWVFFMKKNNNVFSLFKHILAIIKTQFEKSIKACILIREVNILSPNLKNFVRTMV
jgi:hypothetical protein